jgi:DNA-binding MltR family transcriptional regulator
MNNKQKIDTDVILLEYQRQIDDFKKLDGYFEQISTLLLTHLYVEYFTNSLIENYFKLNTKILDDHDRYTFSVKLDLIYEMGFIPEWVYFNIRKLNKIRNAFSHNLHFDALNCDLTFKRNDDEGEIETVDLKNELVGKSDAEKRNYLIIMQIPTLTLVVFAGYIKRGQ